MFAFAKRLRSSGVLGINRRNAEFLLPYNARKLYPLVDDKLQTKKLALEQGIAVPELYAVIEYQHQVSKIHELLKDHKDFVIKPAQGSGGNGVIVISGRIRNRYRKTNGLLLNPSDIEHHLSNILSGIYSLGGQPDRTLIEYLVQFDPVFQEICYQGVPDIRIIVFQGVPVMAMVRLPTRQSDGKANLHQGAIGAGIDITTGQTLSAVWFDKIISEHPETGVLVEGVQVPHWQKILNVAARCYEMTGLGYQGADFVLDKNKGPLLLELNARPGLNIQIANHAGLAARLKLVELNLEKLGNIDERVKFAQEHFSVL
jgi:alpha-L-glutamate ligase-like protein